MGTAASAASTARSVLTNRGSVEVLSVPLGPNVGKTGAALRGFDADEGSRLGADAEVQPAANVVAATQQMAIADARTDALDTGEPYAGQGDCRPHSRIVLVSDRLPDLGRSGRWSG